jgi:hypothetical protein
VARLVMSSTWTVTLCLLALWWWATPGPRYYRMGGADGVLANGYVLLGLAVLASGALDLVTAPKAVLVE